MGESYRMLKLLKVIKNPKCVIHKGQSKHGKLIGESEGGGNSLYHSSIFSTTAIQTFNIRQIFMTLINSLIFFCDIKMQI